MGYTEGSPLCLRAALWAWASPSAVCSVYPVLPNKDDLVCARMGSVGGTGQWVRVTDSGHRPSEFAYQLRHHPAMIVVIKLVHVLMGMCVR